MEYYEKDCILLLIIIIDDYKLAGLIDLNN